MTNRLAIFLLAVLSMASTVRSYAADTIVPMAIIPFQERGSEVKEMGAKVTDLLFANLLTRPDMYLVEREDLKRIVEEQELNLTGVVNPAQAVQLGQLTGAKIIVTGSVLQVNDKLYCVAKIIGTETSRVLGESVNGSYDEDLGKLIEKLADKVGTTVEKRSKELIAKSQSKQDVIGELKKALPKGKRPSLIIDIPERHLGTATNDPAAETELTKICTELGFEVLSDGADRGEADLMMIGEAFSEFASRHGNLVSVKARLEVKLIQRESGRILSADRQTSIETDLAEQIAAKSALESAAAKTALRLVPKLVMPKSRKKN